MQTAGSADIDASGALDLSDFLNRRFNGVFVNEMQGNPFQPDVNYRGYTASPLLGTPQGLSVYMDGVRLNQPFGDVVSWDLIPRIGDRLDDADARLESAVRPEHARRRAVDPDQGRPTAARHQSCRRSTAATCAERSSSSTAASRPNGLHWYVAGNLFAEDGWRDDSPSDVGQIFGKIGWHDAKERHVARRVAYADNSLTGNGLQEQRLLDRDYASVYTKPDETDNRADVPQPRRRGTTSERRLGVAATSTTATSARTRSTATSTRTRSISRSISRARPSARRSPRRATPAFPTSGATAANTPFPVWRCIANVLLQRRARREVQRAAQPHPHGAAQRRRVAARSPSRDWLAVGATQFTVGAALRRQPRRRSSSRPSSATSIPIAASPASDAFGDGVTGGSVDGEPYDTRVDLDGHVHTGSVYATDTLPIGDAWNVTLSGRYNRTSDQQHATGINPGGGPGSLDGDHVFSRFNPAAGVTFSPSRGAEPLRRLQRGQPRADVDRARLRRSGPAVQAAERDGRRSAARPGRDAHVRSRRARRKRGAGRAGTPACFAPSNRDDILFVASTQTGFGYFKNFGKHAAAGHRART